MKKRIVTVSMMVLIVLVFVVFGIKEANAEELSNVNLGDANISVAYDQNASITIERTGNTSNSVTVYYRTINGSAIAGTHYTAKTGTVVLSSGEVSENITIDTMAFDTWENENRFFYVEVYKVEGNAVKDYDQDICKVTISHTDSIATGGLNSWYVLYADASEHHYEKNSSYTTPIQDISNYNYWADIGSTIKALFEAEIETNATDIRLRILASNNSNGSSASGTYDYYTSADGSEDSGEYTVTAYNYIYGQGDVENAGGAWDDGDIDYGEVKIYVTDTTAPSIQSIYTVGNSSQPYSDGEDLYISAKFNEIVNVSGGTPSLPVKFSDNTVSYASYIGGTGTDTLVFKVTIPKDKASTGLYIYNPSNNDSFSGEGYVKDIAGNGMSAYSTTGCMNSNIIIQNIEPTISSITADKQNVSLINGDILGITFNFNEPVMITGAPVLNLSNGKTATMTSGTGGYVLSSDFSYAVGATENSTGLYITSITEGTIVDYSGNTLDRTIDSTNIKSYNIQVDNISPVITLSTNGNSTYAKSQSTKMYISDTDGSGVSRVKYVWNASASTPSLASFTQTGGNTVETSISGVTGTRYLHIMATDVAGNVSYFNSAAFNVDNTSPSITVNTNGGSFSKEHEVTVSLTDSHSGIGSNFKYIWSTSTSMPSDADFNSGSSGLVTTPVLKNTGNGNFYLYIRATDNGGNNSYFKSNVYVFDNTEPDSIEVVNDESRDSYRKSYAISLTATDSNGSYTQGSIANIKYKWANSSTQSSDLTTGFTAYSGQFNYDNDEVTGLVYLHVIAEDTAGNIGYETFAYTFDYTSPSINVTSSDLSGAHKSVTASVEVSDIHNDLSVFKYIWRSDEIENSSNGTWVNGETTGKNGTGNPLKNNETGSWYLHIYCEDSAGNTSYSITGPYIIDIDGPTGSLSISESEINSGLITLNITATDNIASNDLYYALSQDDGATWGDWNSFPNTVTLNNYALNDDDEGVKKVSVKFKDFPGNESAIYFDTVTVDLTPPTGAITYSPAESQGYTNQNVTATLTDLTDNLGGTVVTPNGSHYDFTDNGSYTFEIEDSLGNSATMAAIVTWIDKIDPTIGQISGNQTPSKAHQGLISVTDNITAKSELDVYYQWSNSGTQPEADDGNWITITNEGTVTKNSVDGEWYIHVKGIDKAGNTTIYTSGKYVFDNTAPTGSINITEEFINTNVITINLEASDQYSNTSNLDYALSQDNSNWTAYDDFSGIINDYETTSTEGEHRIYVKFKDELGNESLVYSDGFIIDKTPPSASISYSVDDSDGFVQGSVTATLTNIVDNYSAADEITVNDETYTFNENGSYVFTLADAIGNTTEMTASVDWIDNTAPTISLTPNTDQTPRLSHSVTIHSADNKTDETEIDVYYQWSASDTTPLVDDKDWVEITNNSTVAINGLSGDYYLHVKASDQPGNINYHTSGKFVLDNEGPTGSFNIGEIVTKTNKINLQLAAVDNTSLASTLKYALSTDGNNWSNYTLITSEVSNYEIENSNGETTIYVKYCDELNNESPIYSDSVTLDLIAPSAQIVYSNSEADGYVNTDVTVTLINISDNYSELENISVNTEAYTFETNGSFEFVLTDEVGNVETLYTEVTYIDKENPVIQGISGNLNPEKSHSGWIDVTDNITGINDIGVQYQWSQSEELLADNDSGWIDVPNNTYVTKAGIDGDWYLQIKAEDALGNTSQYISGKFLFDNTPPVGQITYSTESRTAQPVTATLVANETITVTTPIDGSTKYVFNDNGDFQFEFMDLAGNTSTSLATVGCIDKDLPSADVVVSTTSWSKEDITLTVSVASDSRISIEGFDFDSISQYTLEDERARELITTSGAGQYTDYKVYTIGENGKIIFTIQDVDTLLTQEIEVTIDNIDKVNPEYEVSYSETAPTVNDVIINITTSDNSNAQVEILAPETAPGTSGQYTVTSNGTYEFTIKDMAGNEVSIPIQITNIDRVAPVLEVVYSESDWTNQDVTATVTSGEEIIVTNNNGDIDYVFANNGTFKFQVKDLAGNESAITATAINIDKTEPDAELSYSPVMVTNTDVSVTILANEEVVITSAEDLELVENKTNQYIIEDNGTYTFTLTDRGGNTKLKSINIENIDKTKPEITYTLSTQEMTNEDLQIFLQGNESFNVISVPETIETVVTEAETKYYASASGDYTFVIADLAGNITNKVISITNIDKVAPILSVSYSKTGWTNNDVVAMVIADEGITVLNNSGSESKTFVCNGEFEFSVADLAGNESSVTAYVDNIDKVAPNASLTYTPNTMVNTDVVVKIIPNETVVIESIDNLALVSETTDEFIVVTNGDYQFKLIDQGGNETTKTITISNIDKDSPVITYTLSNDQLTNQEVEIYLTGDEAFTVTQVPQGIRTVTTEGVEGSEGIDKYFADISGVYIFEVIDNYGNSGQKQVDISNIDIIPPTLTLSYSAITWTNQDVVATLLADEEIIVLNNNNSFEYTFLQNGEFTFYAEDIAGNEANIKATVEIIDKEDPIGTFQYSTTEMTMDNIRLTITGNESLSQVVSTENLEIQNTTGTVGITSQAFMVTENGDYHFTITDLAGNYTEYEIAIANIDREPPVMTYILTYDTPVGLKEVNEEGVIISGPIITTGDDSESYQDSLITNEDVYLEFNANENFTIIEKPEDVTIDDEGYYVIKENGTYSFTSQDVAGNTTDIEVVISTIEKSTPEVEIVYSETDLTINDVVATVVSTNGNEIRVVNNYNNYSKTFTDNGEYTFIIQDYAGNEIYVTATVNNIDKSSPVLSVTFDQTTYTNESVTVEITANEDFIMLNNDGNKTYTFENNDEVKFVAQDLLGNISEIVVAVDYIDKTAPEIVFTGQEILNTTLGETVDLLADVTTLNYTDSSLTISYTTNLDINSPGAYLITYEVTDLAGNTGLKEREIIVMGDELSLTFDGVLVGDVDYLQGDAFVLEVYNALGEYDILYSEGRLTKGEIKIQGDTFDGETFEIDESSWFTFIIVDQERNTRLYHLLITK